MNQFVAAKFFKITSILPPDENIHTSYKCTLESKFKCSGKLFCGAQSVYFYAKTSYKSLIGKSTKIRLSFKDVKSIQKLKDCSITIEMEVTRSVGQDLRSNGNPDYCVQEKYTFSKLEKGLRDICFKDLKTLLE